MIILALIQKLIAYIITRNRFTSPHHYDSNHQLSLIEIGSKKIENPLIE